LRHLHAVEWLRSGRSIYSLQQRLGHSGIHVTEGYLKYITGDEQQATKYGVA
jgi:integrase/recombinase XerD